MKRYLLDTALVAAFLHGREKVVTLITPLMKRHEAATSILVYAEVTEYLKGLPREICALPSTTASTVKRDHSLSADLPYSRSVRRDTTTASATSWHRINWRHGYLNRCYCY
jgi:hypothetical protein